MKKIIVFLLLVSVLSLAGCVQNSSITVEDNSQEEGMLIHVSTGPETEEGKHKINMALGMAVKMMESGKNVLVFFDSAGADIPLKEVDILYEDSFTSSNKAIRKLVEGGQTVMVCEHCLHVRGHHNEDLIEGVKIADPEEFFNFNKGKTLTLDW